MNLNLDTSAFNVSGSAVLLLHSFSKRDLEMEFVPSFGIAYSGDIGTNYDKLYNACHLKLYECKMCLLSYYEKPSKQDVLTVSFRGFHLFLNSLMFSD